MNKNRNGKIFTFFVLLALSASVLHAQDGGPRLVLSGELTGMYTLGFADESQRVETQPFETGVALHPAGVFDIDSGRNGFMTMMDFGIRFLPLSWVDLFVQFRARSRPGNPYIPLMLEAASADYFALSFEQAWARVNLIEGLGLDVPLDLFVRAGMFDSAPASFHVVSGFRTENVISRIRTKNVPSLQLEGVFLRDGDRGDPNAGSVHVIAATHQRFNEAITPLYDNDGGLGSHGEPAHGELGVIPIFAALQMRNFMLPLGPVSAELVYGLNAEDIFSGHNFGVGGRWEIGIPGTDVTIPLGLGVALLEKNIDPMARAAHGLYNLNALDTRPHDALSQRHNVSTVSFRRSMRIGLGAGLHIDSIPVFPALGARFNLGYSYSQIAHIYRDTLTLNSVSADLRLLYGNRFFIGGGIFLGTLGDAEWRTSADADSSREEDFLHVFRLAENMGFEIHAGLSLGRSRLVLGYNVNRGLSMNHGIEARSDAQIVYRQRGSAVTDGLFETGGFFTKLVIAW